MLRTLTAMVLASLLMIPSAFADESADKKGKDDGFSRYNVNLAGSIFGPSANFGYNTSRKTMFTFAMGAFSGNAPFDPKIGDVTYTASGETTWMGFFVNHRPVDDAQWFRLVAGIGIGSIENELEDSNGNSYRIDYKESPVGYLGIGFGVEAKKGFLWGVDLGVLQTAGGNVSSTGGMGDATEDISDSWMAGTLLPNFQVSLGWGF